MLSDRRPWLAILMRNRNQTHQTLFLNSASFSWSSGSKANSGFGSMITPGLNRPRPNITADLTWGSPLRTPSGDSVSTRTQVIVRASYPMVLGLSRFQKISGCQRCEEEEMVGMNLFSGIMHELVVCTAKYFPISREGGMRDDKITRRITISISYFGVMNTDAIGRNRL